ncbi:MAG TPA: hypothetical protein VF795_10455 [Desulfuromonadaceae bacterium]
MRRMLLILAAALGCWALPAEAASPYGVALSPTPVFNVPSFSVVFGGRDGKTLKTDRCGQVRELEFIALKGAVFRILSQVEATPAPIYRVATDDYPVPAGKALYVDSRFIELRDTPPPPRPRSLPRAAEVVARLRGAIGNPYVWGGNVSSGVPELARLFYRGASLATGDSRLLAGVDCSGLLYQATDGWTPRNTSELVAFGSGVPVTGRSAAELARLLRPLDLIVWDGHVVIVLDRETTIESRLVCGKSGNGGVMTTPLLRRLEQIMRTRRPVDVWPGGRVGGVFVVRRWYGVERR